MTSSDKAGKAPFGKKFDSSNAQMIQASIQPFGDASWQLMADFAFLSTRDTAVMSEVPAGHSGNLGGQVGQLGGTQQGRVGGFSGNQSFSFMTVARRAHTWNSSMYVEAAATIGNGTTAVENQNLQSSALSKNVFDDYDPLQQLGACSLSPVKEAAPERKLLDVDVLEKFDPLQKLGACSISPPNEKVPEWKLSTWRYRTWNGLPRREPNAPRGKYKVYCVRCGAIEDHSASKCEASSEEAREYKKLVDKDLVFSHNGKKRTWYPPRSSKNAGKGDNHRGQKMEFKKSDKKNSGTKQSGRNERFQPAKLGKGGIQNGKQMKTFGNKGKAFRNQQLFSRQSYQKTQLGGDEDQAWFEVADIIQNDRLDKICQKMKLICSLLLNRNNYQAVASLSSIMTDRISMLKGYAYEKDESENTFNSIMAYLTDYQNHL